MNYAMAVSNLMINEHTAVSDVLRGKNVVTNW